MEETGSPQKGKERNCIGGTLMTRRKAEYSWGAIPKPRERKKGGTQKDADWGEKHRSLQAAAQGVCYGAFMPGDVLPSSTTAPKGKEGTLSTT